MYVMDLIRLADDSFPHDLFPPMWLTYPEVERDVWGSIDNVSPLEVAVAVPPFVPLWRVDHFMIASRAVKRALAAEPHVTFQKCRRVSLIEAERFYQALFEGQWEVPHEHYSVVLQDLADMGADGREEYEQFRCANLTSMGYFERGCTLTEEWFQGDWNPSVLKSVARVREAGITIGKVDSFLLIEDWLYNSEALAPLGRYYRIQYLG